MTPERWRRVRSLFDELRAKDAAAQAAWLACPPADDAALRDDLVALLTADKRAATFLEEPPTLPELDDPLRGTVVGPWRVLEPIGRGGMGVVYRAARDDDAFKKEVALKLLWAGPGQDTLVRRFRVERDILARLEHPNIARLLDGGTGSDGRPYLVMELIQGLPIDRWVAAHPELTLPGLVALFRRVCAAVQHAHQNFVIHRDLKPSNILVTADGTPKLLDFGIAKLLDDSGAGALTAEVRALTPRYASPEQVLGRPMTTASDVYSLGVVLYELVTGRPPVEMSGTDLLAGARAVIEVQPERPSLAGGAARFALSQAQRDDLDAVVLMALRKEPQRRYESPRDLADDLQRLLDGWPVCARPDSFRYRTTRWLGRHRLGVAATVLALTGVVGGAATAFGQWRRAEAAAAESHQRYAEVRRLASDVLFEVHAAIENQGASAARALLLQRAIEYLDRLAAGSADPAVRDDVLTGLLKLVEAQGHYGLGDGEAVRATCGKALGLAEPLAGKGEPAPRRLLLARVERTCGTELRALGFIDDGEALLGRAVSLLEELVDLDAAAVAARSALAAAYWERGNQEVERADWPRARQAYLRSAREYERLVTEHPESMHHRQNVALLMRNLAGVAGKQHDLTAAVDYAHRAVAIDRALVANMPADSERQLALCISLSSVGDAEHLAGREVPALAALREALAIAVSITRTDSANVFARWHLAARHAEIAAILAARGDSAAAVAEQQEAVAVWESLSGPGAPRSASASLATAIDDLRRYRRATRSRGSANP